MKAATSRSHRRFFTSLFPLLFLIPAVAGTPAIAELPCYDASANVTPCEGPGGIRHNGHRTQPARVRADSLAAAGIPQDYFTTPGFLFEPESPYESLKAVPTWNEIEQLLDNPYAFTFDFVTPGNFDGYPSYRSNITRRPAFSTAGATLTNPGPPRPQFLLHPLNYNPANGEEMRLLNPDYPGGTFSVPDELYLDLVADPAGNTWNWTFREVEVSPGGDRVEEAEIDYNGPVKPDLPLCVANLELVPPEGTTLCGNDPGEPNYFGFGVNNATGYSRPSVPGVLLPQSFIPSSARLFDATRGGAIQKRNPGNGSGGLRKPSLRVPEVNGSPNNPNYLWNTDANNTTPSNENDYVRDRNAAAVLGKSFFWDMQVGSDGVQSCGTCHFTGPGTDTRTKNQINPNHLGGDLNIDLHGVNAANQELTPADFPFHKVSNRDEAGDPACTAVLIANVSNVTPALDHPVAGNFPVCDKNNIVSDLNDVASSMGVIFNKFSDIAAIGQFQPADNGVKAVMPDLRTGGANAIDPIPVFQGFRRVEPRNTPTMQAAGFNFDNFWDGRARHDFNGGSVFGSSDPQKHVFVNDPPNLTATRQIIKFSSIGSLAPGPGLSEFEMSFLGRNWAKIGKKLLQTGITPLANQLVATNDSVLGPYSNQGGASSACVGLAVEDRSGSWSGTNVDKKPGLCISYRGLIRKAFYPRLWQNANKHLNGCYTDNNAALHPNQCGSGIYPAADISVLDASTLQNPCPGGASFCIRSHNNDPFDQFVLQIASGGASPTDTNQFTQMEGNFSLFWGMGVDLWVQLLVPDDTPFDRFLETNADAFLSLGDTSEVLLVDDLVNCAIPGQRNVTAPGDPGYPTGVCFTEYGNFKRDPGLFAHTGATAEGGGGAILTPAGGTRQAGATDPLLGADIFFASNLSLKNPTFRSARCGACHNLPTLTDNTMPFTFKAQLPDFASEFSAADPGVELLTEPLGRSRVITGFLLESEISENGQDAVERRFINQSIIPNPVDGYAYPDGVFHPENNYIGAGQAFIDNGVYNLGVRPISNDIGRGGTDAFGWPLSLAEMLMKNLGGENFVAGTAMATFNPSLGVEGGLFEESAQDQQINPGGTDEPVNPLLPPYLAPFMNGITVGDAQPDLDEPVAGINTLTDVAMLEGFGDSLGPINPAAVKNEGLNMSESELEGTWPTPNRVLKDGAFKAPQLRDVELTGPYFHNGGQLTLRQVVDFYTRGGDFPMTNAAHRDFLLVNLKVEAQSNLNEDELKSLVDFLLELTDERVAYAKAPFDHPQVVIPVDGLAPDNTASRSALLANPMFRDVPAVGALGQGSRDVGFLGVERGNRNSPNCNPALGPISHYCH